MSDDIQKIILKIVKNNDGSVPFEKIYNHEHQVADGKKINNAIKLLVEDGKLRTEKTNMVNGYNTPVGTYYLTSKGYKELNSCYVKFWRFVIWERHNLFSILAILISLAALIVSIVSLSIRF